MTDRVDISPAAVEQCIWPLIRQVNTGRSPSLDEIGAAIDTLRALSARVATLNAEALEQTTGIMRGEEGRIALEKCIDACVSEYLDDAQTAGEEAYQRGVHDCVEALIALKEKEPRP